MIIDKSLEQFGRYCLFIRRAFAVPDKWGVFGRRTVTEVSKLGIDSIPLVIIISLFIGAVCTIQMKLNTTNPLMPAYSVGLATRDIVLLEFSNSILCLILAGKVGSNIASEIGSMRITEQIDAMDMMGVNSAGFLVLPKITSATLLSPFLMLLSLILGLVGGWLVVETTQIISTASYITGIKFCYNGFYVFYSCFKMSVFSFMISSISAFNGFYAKGGSLGVGHSSTKSIVITSILILLFDLVLTQLMLY